MMAALGPDPISTAGRAAPPDRFALARTVIDRQRPSAEPGVGHALSGDACAAAVDLIRAFEPRCVLELGSGRSTVEIARMVEALDGVTFHAVEHDAVYRRQTIARLASEGLAEAVQVHHAPIGVRRGGAYAGLWYRIDEFDRWPRLDCVLIDGPPARAVGRFMALPVFWPRLNDGALLLLDDANRASLEGAWLDLWRRIYGDALRVEVYPRFHKGLALLMKVSGEPRGGGPLTFARYLMMAAAHTARLVGRRACRAVSPRADGQP